MESPSQRLEVAHSHSTNKLPFVLAVALHAAIVLALWLGNSHEASVPFPEMGGSRQTRMWGEDAPAPAPYPVGPAKNTPSSLVVQRSPEALLAFRSATPSVVPAPEKTRQLEQREAHHKTSPKWSGLRLAEHRPKIEKGREQREVHRMPAKPKKIKTVAMKNKALPRLSSKATVEKQRQQLLAEAKKLEQLREAEMRRITAGSSRLKSGS